MKMPLNAQKRFANVVEDLELNGPIQSQWPNFSKLGVNEYHCHLTRQWVACWRETKLGFEIEVSYAGSRENAPY